MGEQLVAGKDIAVLAYVLLFAVGFLSCFLGYRLFRLLLGLWGFLAGTAIALTLLQGSGIGPLPKLVIALAGGVAGAMLVSLLYTLGVFLFGAGFGLLVASVIRENLGGFSPWPLVVILALGAGVAALAMQRPLIRLFTALGGAWILVASAAALVAGCPLDSFPARCLRSSPWVLALVGAWLVLSFLGFATQTRTTARHGERGAEPN
jgi:hypothetical protein